VGEHVTCGGQLMTTRVRTRYGVLEGGSSPDGRIVHFKGIPYAQPPLGALRWCAPREPLRWDGVRAATAFGAACVQPLVPENSLVSGSERVMSEDCLTLNVYTAGTDAAEKRPVIVWLHHGGFLMGWSGAPLYDGTALARAGAVLVTVNYRLGRLGFLAHPALSAEAPSATSGNYGLMDQVAALCWVRDNIAQFGGDPNCVTIYGVSAGAFSVSALMASPLAVGLFHRAIGSSGGALGPVASSSEGGDFLQSLDAAELTGANLMQSLGARTALELRALPADAILNVKATEFWHARRGLLDTTYPILDGYLLTQTPGAAYRSSGGRSVPLITGSTTDEASIVPFNQDTDSYLADSRAVFGDLYERYVALFPAGPDGLTARSSMAAASDRLFSWQNWQWARQHARYAHQPVYYYRFAHEPPVPPGSVAEQALNARVGAFHSAEIPYVFRNLDVRPWPWTERDRVLSQTMSDYWLAFARSGNPNGGGRSPWLAFADTTPRMRRFETEAGPAIAASTARFAFWDDFYAAQGSGGVTDSTLALASHSS
jgi:para-nitrobenzyl esterase